MSTFRIHFALSLLLPLSLLLASCSLDSISNTITLTDGLNRVITLHGPARRVVSLAPSNTELLYEVGAGATVVGCDDFSDFPMEAKALPSIGGSMGIYDLTAIAALKPDLILAAEINTTELIESLENMGLTVFYLNNPQHMDGLYQNLRFVGTLAGKNDEAESLIKSLDIRIKTIFDKLPDITKHYRVYYELDATDPNRPFTAGPGSYINSLLEAAGDQNIGETLSSSFSAISANEVINQNPDFILLGDTAYGVTVESVKLRHGWSAINAVKNNQVYAFDNDIVSRPTARIVDAIETLARIIHPDIFR